MYVHIPSARNIEVYHRLEDDGKSIRDVAAEFRLSPTRVTQIRSQVHRWYQCSAPDPELDRYRRQHAVGSCRRHETRAGRLFSAMMECFRDSQGEQCRTRHTSSGPVQTTSMCFGDPKFTTYALRYSREQRDASLTIARLPDEYFERPDVEFVAPTAEELALEAEEERQRLLAEAEERRRAQEYAEAAFEAQFAIHESPSRVCTAATPAPAVAAATAAPGSDASSAGDAASEVASILREQHQREAKRRNTPVQTANVAEQRRVLARAIVG